MKWFLHYVGFPLTYMYYHKLTGSLTQIYFHTTSLICYNYWNWARINEKWETKLRKGRFLTLVFKVVKSMKICHCIIVNSWKSLEKFIYICNSINELKSRFGPKDYEELIYEKKEEKLWWKISFDCSFKWIMPWRWMMSVVVTVGNDKVWQIFNNCETFLISGRNQAHRISHLTWET